MREKHKLTNVKKFCSRYYFKHFSDFFPSIDHYIDCDISLEKLLIEKKLGFRRYHGNHPVLPLHSPSAQPLLEICDSEKKMTNAGQMIIYMLSAAASKND
jgi:hypothetical protein